MRNLVCVAIVAIGLAGCGESTGEAAAEKMAGQMLGQDVEVEDDGETVTFGDTRMSSGKAARVPEDFPKDLYLPDGYTLESVMQSPESTVLHMSTTEAAEKLFNDAVGAMTSQGWTQGWSMPPNEGAGLAGFEKDGRRASISVDDRGADDTLYTIETGASRN
jgi:hypothetical protein